MIINGHLVNLWLIIEKPITVIATTFGITNKYPFPIERNKMIKIVEFHGKKRTNN